MKANLKNILISVAVLAAIMVVLVAVDSAAGNVDVSASAQNASLKVVVVDLDGKPVHNASVSVAGGGTFNTDNKGCSPLIDLPSSANRYDPAVSDWFAVDVTVKKDGFVPAFVFGCVVYCNSQRVVTVKVYPMDDSELPYVCYVESPPDEYVRGLLK